MKLYTYGVRGCLLKAIESFISDRLLRVVLEGFTSVECPIKARVSQGNILGLTLFNLHMNDVEDNQAGPQHHFTDDTPTHSVIPKQEDPIKTFLPLHKDLLEIEKWSYVWMVNINTSKTKELMIFRLNTTHTPQLQLHERNYE